MFERFNEQARQVLVLAQDEARRLRHSYIGTEHLLLGLIREDGAAARVLDSFGMTAGPVHDQVARIVGPGGEVTTGQIPLAPQAKKVLEMALREALSLGHAYIGSEHILLGVIRENDGIAARLLLDFDADAGAVRERVLDTIGAPGDPARSRRPRVLEAPPRKRWEYRIETWPPAGAADRMEVLGSLGAEGWELAGSGIGELIFKRPKR